MQQDWINYFNDDWKEYKRYLKKYDKLNEIIGKMDLENPIQKITLNETKAKKQYEKLYKGMIKHYRGNDIGWVFEAQNSPVKNQIIQIDELLEKAYNNPEVFISEIEDMNKSYEGEDLYESIGLYTTD